MQEKDLIAFARLFLKSKWEYANCDNCGWHDCLERYDDDEITINMEKMRFEIPCHSEDDDNRSNHRGAHIYFDYLNNIEL